MDVKSEVKKSPILFTGEMVRAIIAGRKTQTRRVVTEKDCWRNGLSKKHSDVSLANAYPVNDKSYLRVPYRHKNDSHTPWDECGSWRVDPVYQIGDRLWVREKTRLIETLEGGECGIVTGIGNDNKARFRYEADGAESDWIIYPERLATLQVGECIARGCYKEAARIWLEVTNIRVERVQDIDENDACKEGCELYTPETNLGAVRTFSRLWDSINAKRGYGWDKNPWVWVIEFERVCRSCGCTDSRACAGGCSWTAPSLCSQCAGDEVMTIPGPEAAR